MTLIHVLPNRRRLVGLLLAASALVPLSRAVQAACASPTPLLEQGPYYRANAPLRTSLVEKGLPGTRLTLTGRVLDHNCRAVLGALLDVWQADSAGQYDGTGFRLRGRQTTDTQGNYRVETILPGAYAGRTRHIHIKVAAAGGRILTTQLYFPDEPGNATDPLFRRELLLAVQDTPDGKFARFDFVLAPPA